MNETEEEEVNDDDDDDDDDDVVLAVEVEEDEEDETSLRISCNRHFSTTHVMGATRHVAWVMRRQ